MTKNVNYCYTFISVLKKHIGFDGRDTPIDDHEQEFPFVLFFA